MSLTVFNDPFFSEFERSLDRTFDRAFGRHLAPARATHDSHLPLTHAIHAFDVVEHKDAFELLADAPGMTPDEISIELNEGVLTITGSHKEAKKTEEDTEGRRVLRSERKEFNFSRTFNLPDNADGDKISANLDKGILSVRIAKQPEAPKPEPKRINVGTAA